MTDPLRTLHELVRIEPDGRRTILAFLQPRPHYCNRGRFDAHIELAGPHQTNIRAGCELHAGGQGIKVSESDWWPRYYFDLDVAKSELAAWMRAHGIDLQGAVWEAVSYDPDRRVL